MVRQLKAPAATCSSPGGTGIEARGGLPEFFLELRLVAVTGHGHSCRYSLPIMSDSGGI